MLGKAKRVERRSPKQAAYLHARARQLEDVLISAPAQASEELVLGEIDCPALWRTDSAGASASATRVCHGRRQR